MHYSAEVFVALDDGIPLQALGEDAPREEPVDSQARRGKVYVRMPQRMAPGGFIGCSVEM